MNPSRINAFLVRNVLFHQCEALQRTKATAAVLQKRYYRFGRRVNVGGYYVSPQWFDQDLLKNGGEGGGQLTAGSLLRSDGIVGEANRIFDEEKARQRSLVNRIEKIEVQLEKPFPSSEDYVLMMNRNLSTPYDCAAHINELLKNRSALAIVDGTQQWHMHQPLEKSCHLQLLHFKHQDTMPANYAFWRSCSMLLASVVKKAFKEQYPVQILSQPMSDLKGGSFVCDASIGNLNDWAPNYEEQRSITSMLWDECIENRRFERLQVSADVAAKLFANDPKRLAKIDESKRDQFTVYRVGEHLDLSDEAMISSTGLIGSIYLSAVHPIKASNGGQFYRFQGIAIPRQLHINAYTYTIIRDRAKQLNQVGLN